MPFPLLANSVDGFFWLPFRDEINTHPDPEFTLSFFFFLLHQGRNLRVYSTFTDYIVCKSNYLLEDKIESGNICFKTQQ